MNTNEQILWLVKAEVSRALHKKVQGSIKIFFENDTIFIDIDSHSGVVFRYNEYDIIDKISHSESSEMIAFRCARQYRKYILNKFFK